MGPFSSDSKSAQRHTDQSQQASDQAINYSTRRSNNSPVTYRLAKGSTLTINNGISQEDLVSLLNASRTASNAPDTAFQQTLLGEAEKRARASEARAEDEIQAGAPGTIRKWLIAGIAVVLVVAGVVLFRNRKGK